MPLSISGRRYYYACEFLWTAMSLHEYLIEDYPSYGKQMGHAYLSRWSKAYALVINWALEARFFPLEQEQIRKDEEDRTQRKWDEATDPVMFHWVEMLQTEAQNAHSSCPDIAEITWVYYVYCGFLRQVLKIFETLLQQPDSDPIYYEHFLKSKALISQLSGALEYELLITSQTMLDHPAAKDRMTSSQLLAVHMGDAWRDAVLSTAEEP